MGSRIDVHRAVREDDEYGDPQPTVPPAQWPLWKTFNVDARNTAFFAPSNPTEALQPGRNTVISGGVVYIRAAEPTGIHATDVVRIDGRLFAVDGDVGPWSGYAGYKGDQFAVKAVS